MKSLTVNTVKTGILSAALSLNLATVKTAQAAILDLATGWNYSIGLASNGSGGPEFALTGIAIKQDAQNIYVAINGGADPAQGVSEEGVMNGNINYGDLFFNFTGQDFATAHASQSLFGIRFALNDSGVSEAGVYSQIQAKSVAPINNGYLSLQQYFDYGWGAQQTQGTDLPTPQQTKDYYGENGTGTLYNEIDTGTKIGDLSPLTVAVLETLNFTKYGANSAYTFGFQFQKSLLPKGNFVANLLFECNNAGIAIASAIEPDDSAAVPEPFTIAGMMLGGMGLFGIKVKSRSLKGG